MCASRQCGQPDCWSRPYGWLVPVRWLPWRCILLGAPEIAVIELSVGAGLVTVLFVFAINLTGEENLDAKRMMPKPLAWGLLIYRWRAAVVLHPARNQSNHRLDRFLGISQKYSGKTVSWTPCCKF